MNRESFDLIAESSADKTKGIGYISKQGAIIMSLFETQDIPCIQNVETLIEDDSSRKRTASPGPDESSKEKLPKSQ